jgi:hypothetical protein
MTSANYEGIIIKILTSNAITACQVSDEHSQKRAKFEKHRSHRVCFV